MRRQSESPDSDVPDGDDNAMLDLVQRQTFRFFWEGAHPVSGLVARDRQKTTGDPSNDLVAVGGTGFGLMAIIVAVAREWVPRGEAVERVSKMLSFLENMNAELRRTWSKSAALT
jgi:hypothetical protein